MSVRAQTYCGCATEAPISRVPYEREGARTCLRAHAQKPLLSGLSAVCSTVRCTGSSWERYALMSNAMAVFSVRARARALARGDRLRSRRVAHELALCE